MSWHENLNRVQVNGRWFIAGSFRGATFFVEDHTLTGGRKLSRDDLPYADDPLVDDLGRKARDIAVNAYVIGENYTATRDALVDALEASGPGELIHPYLTGARSCFCDVYTLSETRVEGRIATIAITFYEAPLQQASPVAQVDARGEVATAAAAARTAARGDFVATYAPAGQPAFGLESLQAVVSEAGAALDKAYAPLVSNTDDVAAFRRQANTLVNDAVELALSPVELYDTLAASFAFALAPPSIPAALADLLSRLSRSTVQSPASTPARLQEKINLDASQKVQRRLALIAMCETAVSTTYPSDVEAEATRVDLEAKLLDEAEAAESDEVYNTLTRLRVATSRAVPNLAQARRVEVDVPYTIPSLVVAHNVYGSTARELEIVARNRIPHPGFVVGGQRLGVLIP